MNEPSKERTDPLGRQALSLPNLLTYLRVLAIPAVLLFMAFDSPRNAFIGAMIFAAASVTDAIDGWIARRWNLTSVLGKFLDPLADKLLVLAALLMLLDLGRMPVWVALVLLAREMTVTSLRSIAATEGLVIAARDLGKKKTAFQMVGLWALLVHYPYPIELFDAPIDFHRLGLGFIYISVFFSLLSAWDYFAGFVRAVRGGRGGVVPP
ncbi:MAG: CDP-diacylglycerol--glycerol-3-phosphate 3-phosphatidyltransferase [Deltaproteobacteria bacterium]|nr:CDP-diacylglycerol--glycerol-3-phosphate 3-phosphatidyltransferase [Deltaproteobacteria bacterium]